ncbi:hypothetical protein LK994_06700 [Ferruginibacter lapsinanis]|uniref:hypothetical protein n=1 Tax=Ferruginibacter lapsinanis TaxID=563172 RepID=UPI001E4F7DAC|nr:hypothetical protein [Ferruginibacter lapsinanis]UEG51162.1 hypothetical protein LK994_06700 [Ferruginibacter lapsinanis]
MERRMNTDNFERMLREKADEFKMYPSARVWHSIYNNMHPSRRWPSLTMSIVLIALLMLIGYTNSEVTPNQSGKIAANNISSEHKISTNNSSEIVASNFKVTSTKENISSANNTATPQSIVPVSVKVHTQQSIHPINTRSINTAELNINKTSAKEYASPKTTHTIAIAENPELTKIIPVRNLLETDEKGNLENASIENNNLTSKKEQGKLGLQIYAAPSVVYGTENFEDNSSAQKPSVGLEVGASMQYAIFKKLKLKTGLQLNYTNYNTQGYQNPDFYASNNIYAPVKLNNETYQLSLPVGVELKLLGKDRLHWDIGATIQPTYVIGGGNAYTVASGKASYIKESSMLNNWNLNAGFETFITYKINGLTWQLGPQFRYQFMPTYNKNFIINENLANYGVKLGVSKVLQ